MKKRILLFLLITAAVCPPAWSQMRGDLNGDGQVDVTDVDIMIDMVLGKASPNYNTADLDGNGMIDVSDVNAIIDIVLGKTSGDDPNIQTFTANGISFKMVKVEGGSFTMGATVEQGDDANSSEKPAHQVRLNDYSIGETEVTQALWEAVMGRNPSYFTGDGQRPVERVTWTECMEFIARLNRLTGEHFRLPTEAEWEYAARGGRKSNGYKYAGSNTLADVAWYFDNACAIDEGDPDYGTHEVGTKRPNELGLYDMSGNVFEWCQDWYDNTYYGSSPSSNPMGPDSGTSRVIRGGCWYSTVGACRVSYRGSSSGSGYGFGFRLAL